MRHWQYNSKCAASIATVVIVSVPAGHTDEQVTNEEIDVRYLNVLGASILYAPVETAYT